ncbi:MAG: chromate transporter [Ruminococcaceae bacterium]|nr:chromate transporter [Oscillospiraceae bacterium]
MELLSIFWTFVKVGALTFGGGYAMLPILQREIVEKKNWLPLEEIMDYYAMGQCLPGIIMLNTSVFIGRKRKGVAGGIAAGLGAVMPSLIIITAISAFLTSFSHIPQIKNAFAGIRVCVVVLILNALVKLWEKSVVDWKCFIIFITVMALSVLTDVSPIIFVLLSALAGIIISRLGARKV